jgi:hypothetical protein
MVAVLEIILAAFSLKVSTWRSLDERDFILCGICNLFEGSDYDFHRRLVFADRDCKEVVV